MKKNQTLIIWIVAYLFVPAGLLMQLYLLLPFTAELSLRWLILLVGLLLILEAVLWLQYRYFIQPSWIALNSSKKMGWIVTANILTFLLFAYSAPNATQVMEKFPILAPMRSLELHPINNSSDAIIDIWKVKISNQRVPNSELRLAGAWQEEKNRLWTNDPAAGLIVEGKVPDTISISFWRSPSAGNVQVQWDGKSQILQLNGQKTEEIIYRFSFDNQRLQEPGISRLIRWLTLPGWACLAFLACGVYSFKNQI